MTMLPTLFSTLFLLTCSGNCQLIRTTQGTVLPACGAGYHCACARTANCTLDNGCYTLRQTCDGINDCGDWSDEVDCCLSFESPCDCYATHTCYSFKYCYDKQLRCDGMANCDDWSDERNCSCRPGQFQCACYADLTCKGTFGCVGALSVCDGVNDCGDWSDEANCTAPTGTFACDCYRDRSCPFSSYASDRSNWLPPYQVCDHVYQCIDNSDEEQNCTCQAPIWWKCKCFTSGTCQGQSTGCIEAWRRCDVAHDCADHSDEMNCPVCPMRNQTACPCVGSCDRDCAWTSSFCDGVNDCGDWSDEFDCQCAANRFRCKAADANKMDCVERSNMHCKNATHCRGFEKSLNCSCGGDLKVCGCEYPDWICQYNSSSPCIPEKWIADGIVDCPEASDEPCPATKIWCESCPVIINQCPAWFNLSEYKTATRINQFWQSSGLVRFEWAFSIFTSLTCNSSGNRCYDTFLCLDDTFLSNLYFCDQSLELFRTCKDGSDEMTTGLGFKCAGRSRLGTCVLPQINLEDSVAQCADKSDLCVGNGTQFKCFLCLDNRLIISNTQVCDGIVDCYDLSDECLCENQTVCQSILGDSVATCPPNQMHCHTETDCVNITDVICKPTVNCSNGTNVKHCSTGPATVVVQTMNCGGVKAVQCDGRPQCSNLEDECWCDISPPFCHNFCVKTYMSMRAQAGSSAIFHNQSVDICDGKVGTMEFYSIVSGLVGRNCSHFDEASCPKRFNCRRKGDLVSIDVVHVCDGKIDCDDGSDESRSLCNESRFYCDGDDEVMSIDIHFRCDGVVDCPGGSDESPSLCVNRFYCYDGKPLSIDKKLVGNGQEDCSDGSDECTTLFSNRYEMISNPFFRVMFWLMGTVGLVGNFVMFWSSVRRLLTERELGSVAKCTTWFVISLALADILMGVYLIGVSAHGLVYSGSYCRHDKGWRTGLLCGVYGACAVTSIAASTFTMTAMTTFRLVSIRNPLKARNVSVSAVVLPVVVLTWLAALPIGFIPLYPFKSGYFVSRAWFPNQFYSSDLITKGDALQLAQRISKNVTTNWMQVVRLIDNTFWYSPIKGEVGYYAETSVCMPRLFANTQDAAWQYSLLLRSLSVAMFLYMVFAYVLIYRRSKGMAKMKNFSGQQRTMQRRITWLILTDFCCLGPVMIMGYVGLGGYTLPKQAYVASGGLLLPINSALNPLIYSKVFENIVKKCRLFVRSKTR